MVKSTLSSFRAAYLQASASHPSAAAPTIQHLPRVLYVSDLLFGKGIAHDMVSQCLLAGLVISGDTVPYVNTEPAVAPVHELLDEIVSFSEKAVSDYDMKKCPMILYNRRILLCNPTR
jgi:hypothetical protein